MEWLGRNSSTIFVLLWAIAVIAFLVWFFRKMGGWRYFVWTVLALVVIALGLVLQFGFLADVRGYPGFVDAAARIGRLVLVLAVIGLALAIAVLIFYAIRRGRPEADEGKVVTENRVLGVMPTGTPGGVSKVKMLAHRSGFVSMKSLVSGDATKDDRLMAFAIITMFASLGLLFLGAGLMMIREFLIFGILLAIVPGCWVYARMRPMWDDYREAKARLRAHRG
jgi:hypothetical protein